MTVAEVDPLFRDQVQAYIASGHSIHAIIFDSRNYDGFFSPFICECGGLLDTHYGDCLICEQPLCATCQERGDHHQQCQKGDRYA